MKKIVIFIVYLLLVTISCHKEDTEDSTTIPTITTLDVTEITATTATSGGDISDDGGEKITSKGVCWSTAISPTIYDSSTDDGGNSGDFSSRITGLSDHTTYYVRAYATNNKGTAYGNEFTFSTQSIFPGETTNVTGGTFSMGSDNVNEKPIHTVNVNSFKMSKLEITNLQFVNFMNEKGVNADGSYEGVSYIKMEDHEFIEYSSDHFIVKNHEKYPVVKVSWYGAKAYSEYYGGRLPTEAEWEFAAGGGTNSHGYLYAGSDTIDDVAWYLNNSGDHLHDVGTKSPNELGLYDMSGNVLEWCSDWYDSNYYNVSPGDNPQGPTSGSDRVLKSSYYVAIADYCRVTTRYHGTPNYSVNGLIGFRPVFEE